MEETSKTSDKHERLKYPDLIDLYKHYWTVMFAELDFCQKYLNFYSGLLSALLAATLAGLLSLKFRGWDEFALLIGPILIFVLAYNGYYSVKTFYIRFIEAWVTTINLESMLHIRYSPQPITLDYKPRYISDQGSFIPSIEDDRIKGILDDKEKKKGAEQVAKELSESRLSLATSETLSRTKITFIVFALSAGVLAVFIILTAAFPSLFLR